MWSPGRGDRSGGVAARPAFFLASGQRHATSSTRRTLARRQQTESVVCQQWTAADASELVRCSTVLLVVSLVVTLVEFPTHLLFESETCRASVFWETRG